MLWALCNVNRNYIIRNIGNLIIFFPFFSVPIPSEAKESKPDVVEELMKKMFMRKVMAKFFGDANGMLSIYVFPVLLKRSCSGQFLLNRIGLICVTILSLIQINKRGKKDQINFQP